MPAALAIAAHLANNIGSGLVKFGQQTLKEKDISHANQIHAHIYTNHNPKVNETDLCEVRHRDEKDDQRHTCTQSSSALGWVGEGNLHLCS